MRPWLSFVVFAFSIGAAMAEDLPPAVQKAIAENKMEIVVTDGRHIGQVRKTCPLHRQDRKIHFRAPCHARG